MKFSGYPDALENMAVEVQYENLAMLYRRQEHYKEVLTSNSSLKSITNDQNNSKICIL